MSTLLEIEKAAEALPPKDQQELFLFLGKRLRSSAVGLPEPRLFSKEQIDSWLEEDVREMEEFRASA